MSFNNYTIILFFAGIALAGCAPKFAPASDGKPVRTTSNPAVVEKCEFLGNVSAYSGWGGSMAQGVGEANSTSKATRKAAAMGGDTILISTQNVGTSGATLQGEVFRCR